MIVVNARFLTQRTTGIQRFATEITRELLEIRSDIVLAVPSGPFDTAGLDTARIVRVGRARGHAWEQIDLPIFTRRRSALLLNLASTGPVRYRPQISTHHDITYIRHPESFGRRFRAVYGFVVPRLIAHSDGLLTVSEFSRGEIAEHFGVDPQRFTVVYNGADSRFHQGEAPAGRPYLLAVSSPNAHKNFARMLSAFERFAQTHPDIELRVVGSQTNSFSRQRYEGSPAHVRFLGRVDDDELTTLYRGALAFVFPSLYEGFGIPPLEAQQCGCPVIAARAASMPEVLASSAVYVDPYDEADLADAMSRVVDDHTLRAHLIAAGLANAERFSWRASAERVSTVIDHVRAARNGRTAPVGASVKASASRRSDA
ncbi:glycosyltransferase involved in cell wall biosynthesis [Microbacterium sp. SORGH_AS 1204]|uniref:glycosyltransferase family 4 protein n=1 Tax=Microbacterium sp. SORGH_AS_1204 TaxID=3041785 RepID=UPI0027928771|nr:glycosyltransferase family 1 protein [Microbacterium sp. SORGH_AS_1204]MDQ1135687.1 glycosyltransferase involved in cell wall biosynthesis [Microbacterium sp. SORGH_AS_1204]